MSIAFAPIAPALIFFLTIDRHEEAGVVGLILSAYGVGSLVGALLAGRLSHGPLGRIMLIANLGSAVMVAGFALAPVTALQVGFSLIVGITNALVFIPYLTLRATIPPNELLGRVGSTARMISIGLGPDRAVPGGHLAGHVRRGGDDPGNRRDRRARRSLLFAFSVPLRTASIKGATTGLRPDAGGLAAGDQAT